MKTQASRRWNATKAITLTYTVKEGTILMDFLLLSLTGKSRNNIKSLLSRKQILVNDVPVSQFDFKLYAKDEVKVTPFTNRRVVVLKGEKLSIIHEDDELIVINKTSGLISVASEKESEKTAFRLVSEHVQHNDANARVFVVHRLDEDTSGVLIFAKNPMLKEALQKDWNTIVKKRGYHAIVEGKLEEEQGTVKSFLHKTKTNMMYSGHKSKDGQYAETEYKVVKSNDKYTLVDVNIKTGRKNQIRVHMNDLGHPVVGDKKYGVKNSEAMRLMLHAYELQFIHPLTKKLVKFKANTPKSFEELMK
jgi:RluA family pseudouridine synthase